MDINERVSRGVELLDEKVPQWWNDIDIDDLDMCNPHFCILGQLFDQDYSGGREALGIAFGCGDQFGFDVSDEEIEDYEDHEDDFWNELRSTWIKEIRLRQS